MFKYFTTVFLKEALTDKKRTACHTLYERLVGKSEVSPPYSDEHLGYSVETIPALVTKIAQEEADLRGMTHAQVQRQERVKREVKTMEAKSKEDTKLETQTINNKAAHIQDLNERLLTLTKLKNAMGSGSGAGGGSGVKRPAGAPPSAQPKAKKSITLASLLKTMRETSEGLAILGALEDEAITGSPALLDGKVTGKPFTVTELEENLIPKVARVLRSEFLWYLLEFNILTDDEADGEGDDGEGGDDEEGEGEEEG